MLNNSQNRCRRLYHKRRTTRNEWYLSTTIFIPTNKLAIRENAVFSFCQYWPQVCQYIQYRSDDTSSITLQARVNCWLWLIGTDVFSHWNLVKKTMVPGHDFSKGTNKKKLMISKTFFRYDWQWWAIMESMHTDIYAYTGTDVPKFHSF